MVKEKALRRGRPRGARVAGAGDCAPGAAGPDVANGLVGYAVEGSEDLAGAEVARGVDVECGGGRKNSTHHSFLETRQEAKVLLRPAEACARVRRFLLER